MIALKGFVNVIEEDIEEWLESGSGFQYMTDAALLMQNRDEGESQEEGHTDLFNCSGAVQCADTSLDCMSH